MHRLLGLLAVALLIVLPTGSAAAQDTGWVIESFHAEIHVQSDGSLDVVETIEVDFRNLRRHGIYRNIPVRYDLSPGEVTFDLPAGLGPEDVLRALRIDGISVSSTAPDDIEVSRPDRFSGRDVSIRIGDPDRTVTGAQRYEIRYRVRGAMNTFDTHDELYWNVTGVWPVEIVRASAEVRAPQVTDAACFRGVFGSTRWCDDVNDAGTRVVASALDLAPSEQMTVVVGMAKGAVQVPPPLLVEKWDLSRAFSGHSLAWPLAGLVTLLLAVWLFRLLYRQGRDRVAVGAQSVDGVVTNAASAPRPLFSPRTTPVQFRPPEDFRPAQLGLLVDERVDPVDISATLVDLAVRGHLVIAEETSKTLWFSKTDWRLSRQPDPDDKLLPYEKKLLNSLFSGRDEVSVGELKGTFASEYQAVQQAVEDDAVKRKWFTQRPSKTRGLWLGIAILFLIAGAGLFVAAMLFTKVGVAALPFLIAGFILLFAHRSMPHRTAIGSDLLSRTLGFREFIRTAEAGPMDFAEEQNLFVRYLPYAVVFGAVDRWAQRFAHLGQDVAQQVGAWYVSSSTGGLAPDLGGLSSGLSDFAGSVGGTLATAPASSGGSGSGGGSGGGMGGGGGGSW